MNIHPETLRTRNAVFAVQLSPLEAAINSMKWLGCVIRPVPKSDKASPAMSKFGGEWRLDVRYIVMITSPFPMMVKTDIKQSSIAITREKASGVILLSCHLNKRQFWTLSLTSSVLLVMFNSMLVLKLKR